MVIEIPSLTILAAALSQVCLSDESQWFGDLTVLDLTYYDAFFFLASR